MTFLNEQGLLRNIKNGAITAKKEKLVDAIMSCLSAKGLKPRMYTVEQCPPKFTKSTLKKDDQTNFPKKGDIAGWHTF
ncbi:peptidyl-prolyl cis-trans isomerase FKBP3-like isoform X2 [Stigmatopora argus]